MDRQLPAAVEVIVETPRGGFVKYRPDGRVAFVSPLPCPFNYGSVPGTIGNDGDPLDAIVLGAPLWRGHRSRWPVRGVVRFIDAGCVDDKLVCAREWPSEPERRLIVRFFRLYAAIKRIGHRASGRGTATRLLAYEEAQHGP